MADAEVRRVLAEPLSSDGWQAFGQVVGADECVLELRGGAEFYLDVLSYDWRPLRCEILNRHHTATQTLIPLGGAPAVVVVAPPEVDFTDPAHLDELRAFTISGAQGINIAIATWHWGPYPIGRDVHLANVQGRDVAGDVEVAHLRRDLGVVIEVQV